MTTEPPKPLVCELCGKKLSKKRARMINGKVMCSPCALPPLKGGVGQHPNRRM